MLVDCRCGLPPGCDVMVTSLYGRSSIRSAVLFSCSCDCLRGGARICHREGGQRRAWGLAAESTVGFRARAFSWGSRERIPHEADRFLSIFIQKRVQNLRIWEITRHPRPWQTVSRSHNQSLLNEGRPVRPCLDPPLHCLSVCLSAVDYNRNAPDYKTVVKHLPSTIVILSLPNEVVFWSGMQARRRPQFLRGEFGEGYG